MGAMLDQSQVEGWVLCLCGVTVLWRRQSKERCMCMYLWECWMRIIFSLVVGKAKEKRKEEKEGGEAQ